ncbi:MAG: preprotein translocase subunit SecE [Enterocloster sp.]
MEENTVSTVATTEKTAKADKAEKKASKKEKKPSFFKGLKKEYKKIVFPDKETVGKQTVAVVTMSIFIGALIAVLDLVMKFGLSFIL